MASDLAREACYEDCSLVVANHATCNALFIYLIILLDNIIYCYILYDFWWLCDV